MRRRANHYLFFSVAHLTAQSVPCAHGQGAVALAGLAGAVSAPERKWHPMAVLGVFLPFSAQRCGLDSFLVVATCHPLREKTPTEQHHSLNREHCVLFALAGVFDLISRKAQSFPMSIVHTLAQSTSCAPEALLARGGGGERELPMCTPNASVFLSQYELHWAKQNATPDRVPKRLRDGRLWLRSSIAGTKRALFFSMRQRALVLFAPAYSVGVGASSP